MTDKIQTQFDVVTNMGNSITEFQRLSKYIKESNQDLESFKQIGDGIKLTFDQIGDEIKQVMNLLKQASLGTVGGAINRAAASGERADRRGSEEYISLQIAKEHVSVRKQLATLGEQLVNNYRIEARIRQGISDTETLQYQRELALAQIAKISLENGKNKKALLGEQQRKLTDIEAGLKSMESLEKNRTRYLKEQEQLRKKELADQQKALDLETRKQNKINKARQVDSEGKPMAIGGGIIGEINRKSMGELLITQTKLLLNYQLIGAALNSFQFSVGFVRDLDKAFYELQAIGELTQSQMEGLRKSIIDVATGSKFSAVEVAQASIVLAQAGYSGEQIQQSIKSISLLATAAGTDLKQAVDIVTSAINVFNYQVEQSTQIANVITSALNESKLSIEQLGLGIQYASNIAADANIPFGEMIASFGVLSDAGIRSGSTIGTGYRQLINDIQAPSEKLKVRLTELGLTMEDVNIKSKGLAGVIRTLSDAGFSTADALHTLEVRAASTYSALSKGVADIELTQQKYLLSQAAIKANDVQMQSLDNAIKQLTGSIGALVYTLTQDLVGVLVNSAKGLTELIKSVMEFSHIIQGTVGVIIAGMVAIPAGVALWKTLMYTVETTSAVFLTLKAVILGVQGIFLTMTSVISVAWGLTIGAATAAMYGLYKAFQFFAGSATSVTSELERNATRLKDASAQLDKYEQQGRQVTKFLEQLRDKQKELSSNTDSLRTKILEAKLAFDGLGGTIINLSDNYETLVQKVGLAKKAIHEQVAAAAQAVGVSLRLENQSLKKQIEERGTSYQLPASSYIKARFNESDAKLIEEVTHRAKGPLLSDKQIQEFIGSVSKLSKRGDQITDPKQSKFLLDFLDTMNKQVGDLRQIQTNNLSLDQVTRKEQTAKWDARISGFSMMFEQALGQVSEENKKVFQNAATSAEVTKAVEAQRKVVDGVSWLISNIEEFSLDGLSLAQLQAFDSLKNYQASAKRELDGMLTVRSALQDRETEQKKKEINTQLDVLKEQAKLANAGDRQKILSEYTALQDQLTQFEIAKIRAAAAKPDAYSSLVGHLRGDTPEETVKRQALERTKYMEAEIKDAVDEANKRKLAFATHLQNESEKYRAAVDDKLLPTIEDLKNSFEDLTNATKHAVALAELPMKKLEIERKAMDIGDNRFNISNAQRTLKDREIEQQRGLTARDTLDAYLKQQRDLFEKKVSLEALKAKLEAKAMSAGYTGKDLAGSARGKRAGEELQSLQNQYKSATDTLQQMNAQLDELSTKIPEVTAEMDALLNPKPPQPFWEVFSDSLDVYMKETTRAANSNVELGKSFTAMFANINQSLTTTVKNFALGTGSIKESFRNMATSILSDMLDIASKRAAGGLFDLVFSGFGAAIGSLGTSASAPIQGLGEISVVNLPAPGMAQGGIVRGGIPNRDSVRRTLMPGEGVLTKSAVSMLGEDTINALNQSGNRVTSQSEIAKPDTSAVKPIETVQNIYLVDDRAKIPSLGPNDVIMVVGDNINRGGALKRAVRSAMG